MSLSNDDIQQLIAILQRGLSTDSSDNNNDAQTTKSTRKTKQPKVSKKNTAETSEPKAYNKFDSMPENTMHKDDSRIDKLLIKHPPTQRSRDFETIQVICRVCGKKETVNPILVHESSNRYKCNKCARVPG